MTLSPEQKQAMIDHLATKVMGFTKELAKTDKPCKVWIYITGPDPMIDWIECCHFDPFTNIEQALGLLDQFAYTSLERQVDTHQCCIDAGVMGVDSDWRGDRCSAICIACCRASWYAGEV